MRNLIALLACSFVMMAASANDPPKPKGETKASAKAEAKSEASSAASASAAASEAAGKASTESIKPKLAMPKKAAAAPAASAQAQEDQSEVDLSAKIAERLAVMRANQAARAAAAAKARKAAVAKAEADAKPVVLPPAHGTQWSYEGELGPANWSKINVDWAKCGSGTRQAPIDLRDGMKVDLEQIAFDYHPSSFNVIDNGHTVLVTVGSGNYITVANRTFELQQFHFHRPSEERVNGRSFEMVVHLVHKDAEGKQAILALLLERGKPQNVIQTIWNNLPLEKNTLVQPAIVLDPGELLPAKRGYYTYMGSMTEPPCSEEVLWMVMKEPVQASPEQMALFSRLYPLNARPTQPTSGRIIKESN